MSAPATASGMTLTLPGSVAEVTSFSVSHSGHDTIDVTTLDESGSRTYVATPLGDVAEATVSYLDTGSPLALGTKGTITIGTETFYGICISSSATASVNDYARFEATFRQVTDTSS